MNIKTSKNNNISIEDFKHDIYKNELTGVDIKEELYVKSICMLLSDDDFKDNKCLISIKELKQRRELKTSEIIDIRKKEKQFTTNETNFRFYGTLFLCNQLLLNYFGDNTLVTLTKEEATIELLIYKKTFQEINDLDLTNVIPRFIDVSQHRYVEQKVYSQCESLDDCLYLEEAEMTDDLCLQLGVSKDTKVFEVLIKSKCNNSFVVNDMLTKKKIIALNIQEQMRESWSFRKDNEFRGVYTVCKAYIVINKPAYYLSSYNLINAYNKAVTNK